MIEKLLIDYHLNDHTSIDYRLAKHFLTSKKEYNEKQLIELLAISKSSMIRYIKRYHQSYYDFLYQLKEEKHLLYTDRKVSILICGDVLSLSSYYIDELRLLVSNQKVKMCASIDTFDSENYEYIIYVNKWLSIYSLMGNHLYEAFVYEAMLHKRKTYYIGKEKDFRLNQCIESDLDILTLIDKGVIL